MPDRKLYPDGYYAFNADAIGELGDDGQVYYQSAILVHIGKYEAMRILRQIANSSLLDVDSDPYRLTLSFSGTIERIED